MKSILTGYHNAPGSPIMKPFEGKIETIVDAGDFEGGDGVRFLLLPNVFLLQVQTPDRFCEIQIPIVDVLAALGNQAKQQES